MTAKAARLALAISAEAARPSRMTRPAETILASPKSVAINGETIAAGGGTLGPINY